MLSPQSHIARSISILGERHSLHSHSVLYTFGLHQVSASLELSTNLDGELTGLCHHGCSRSRASETDHRQHTYASDGNARSGKPNDRYRIDTSSRSMFVLVEEIMRMKETELIGNWTVVHRQGIDSDFGPSRVRVLLFWGQSQLKTMMTYRSLWHDMARMTTSKVNKPARWCTLRKATS